MVSSFAPVPVVAVPCCVPVVPRDVTVSPSEFCLSRSATVEPLRFGRRFRLVKPAEFSDVFAARRVLRGTHFALHVRASGLPTARLGLVIPKKQAATAVLRNAVKRQAREAFRLRRPRLPALDLVLRLTAPVSEHDPAARSAWRSEIGMLFDRLDAGQAT
jgi:ribonuclease P protein component